jgi:hypothetical protein
MKASELVQESLDKLEKLENESKYLKDYEFSLGVFASRMLLESTLVKILLMEKDMNVSDR